MSSLHEYKHRLICKLSLKTDRVGIKAKKFERVRSQFFSDASVDRSKDVYKITDFKNQADTLWRIPVVPPGIIKRVANLPTLGDMPTFVDLPTFSSLPTFVDTPTLVDLPTFVDSPTLVDLSTFSDFLPLGNLPAFVDFSTLVNLP